MKISHSWLQEFVNTKVSHEEVAEVLTNVGLEVESLSKWESIKGGLNGLKIGLVKEVQKHPDADKLVVTKVNIGSETDLQIVCGAPNVAAGQKVIVAEIGTVIHPVNKEPFRIGKAKIRGIESQGMICAEDEIGLGHEHSGIVVLPVDAPVGKPARDYYIVYADFVFDIGLTPNRGDAMSHLGVARDLVAFLKSNGSSASLKIPDVSAFSAEDTGDSIKIEIPDPNTCSRYSALTMSGIKLNESPQWLKTKLQAVGLRPINSIVDITNFVMLECGQPLHAFDAEAIDGNKVIVKTLSAGTLFQTLDNKEIKLTADDLMICSATQPLCIAGVYGGMKSGVTNSTKNIFLESACFNSKMIRRTSFRHQLRTDAAMRFEKGTDPNLTTFALKRAAMLIKEICGGKISGISDVYPSPVKEKKITLTREKLNRVAGDVIPKADVVKILEALQFRIIQSSEEVVEVLVPTFKTDVQIAEDVIEEILRIYGLNKIPLPDSLHSSISFSGKERNEEFREMLSFQLSGLGFREMINNSISNSSFSEKYFPAQQNSLIKLLSYSNTGLDSLRASLLFGGLETIRFNLNRKQLNLRLFEFGKVYGKENDQYKEQDQLVLFITGNQSEESWLAKESAADFYFLKGIVNAMLTKCGIQQYNSTPLQNSTWQSGMVYQIGKQRLVSFGDIQPSILSDFDIKKSVLYAEFDLEVLKAHSAQTVSYIEPSKFPFVRRDLALVIDSGVSFHEIEQHALKVAGPLLKNVNLFDLYMDKKLGENKKSYAISFTLGDDQKTLTDTEVEKVMEKITSVMQKDLKATIRS